jgi:hypothetical protein
MKRRVPHGFHDAPHVPPFPAKDGGSPVLPFSRIFVDYGKATSADKLSTWE